MFVSQSCGFLFLANQKCASTSVSRVIRQYCTVTPQTHNIITHSTFREAITLLENLHIDPFSLTSFTLIRNPWERMVSFFKHIHNEQSRHPFWVKVSQETNEFPEFLRREDVQEHLRKISAEEFCFDSAKRHRVDRIFTMEHMHKELPPFLKHMNVNVAGFPHARNQGGSHDYKAWYDVDTRRIVEDLFASDIDIGQYSFG